jgi:hypothetical protein
MIDPSVLMRCVCTDITSSIVSVFDDRLHWLSKTFDLSNYQNHRVTIYDTPGIVLDSHLVCLQSLFQCESPCVILLLV